VDGEEKNVGRGGTGAKRQCLPLHGLQLKTERTVQYCTVQYCSVLYCTPLGGKERGARAGAALWGLHD